MAMVLVLALVATVAAMMVVAQTARGRGRHTSMAVWQVPSPASGDDSGFCHKDDDSINSKK